MKHLLKSPSFLALLGSMFGMVAMGSIFVTLSSVTAAPTVAPPNGNPVFPAVGPTGPQGPQGPTGPSGASASLSCVQGFTTHTVNGGTYYANCPAGYVMTGGGLEMNNGSDNEKGIIWSQPWGNTAWRCGGDMVRAGSVCHVRCCKLQ